MWLVELFSLNFKFDLKQVTILEHGSARTGTILHINYILVRFSLKGEMCVAK